MPPSSSAPPPPSAPVPAVAVRPALPSPQSPPLQPPPPSRTPPPPPPSSSEDTTDDDDGGEEEEEEACSHETGSTNRAGPSHRSGPSHRHRPDDAAATAAAAAAAVAVVADKSKRSSKRKHRKRNRNGHRRNRSRSRSRSRGRGRSASTSSSASSNTSSSSASSGGGGGGGGDRRNHRRPARSTTAVDVHNVAVVEACAAAAAIASSPALPLLRIPLPPPLPSTTPSPPHSPSTPALPKTPTIQLSPPMSPPLPSMPPQMTLSPLPPLPPPPPAQPTPSPSTSSNPSASSTPSTSPPPRSRKRSADSPDRLAKRRTLSPTGGGVADDRDWDALARTLTDELIAGASTMAPLATATTATATTSTTTSSAPMDLIAMATHQLDLESELASEAATAVASSTTVAPTTGSVPAFLDYAALAAASGVPWPPNDQFLLGAPLPSQLAATANTTTTSRSSSSSSASSRRKAKKVEKPQKPPDVTLLEFVSRLIEMLRPGDIDVVQSPLNLERAVAAPVVAKPPLADRPDQDLVSRCVNRLCQYYIMTNTTLLFSVGTLRLFMAMYPRLLTMYDFNASTAVVPSRPGKSSTAFVTGNVMHELLMRGRESLPLFSKSDASDVLALKLLFENQLTLSSAPYAEHQWGQFTPPVYQLETYEQTHRDYVSWATTPDDRITYLLLSQDLQLEYDATYEGFCATPYLFDRKVPGLMRANLPPDAVLVVEVFVSIKTGPVRVLDLVRYVRNGTEQTPDTYAERCALLRALQVVRNDELPELDANRWLPELCAPVGPSIPGAELVTYGGYLQKPASDRDRPSYQYQHAGNPQSTITVAMVGVHGANAIVAYRLRDSDASRLALETVAELAQFQSLQPRALTYCAKPLSAGQSQCLEYLRSTSSTHQLPAMLPGPIRSSQAAMAPPNAPEYHISLGGKMYRLGGEIPRGAHLFPEAVAVVTQNRRIVGPGRIEDIRCRDLLHNCDPIKLREAMQQVRIYPVLYYHSVLANQWSTPELAELLQASEQAWRKKQLQLEERDREEKKRKQLEREEEEEEKEKKRKELEAEEKEKKKKELEAQEQKKRTENAPDHRK